MSVIFTFTVADFKFLHCWAQGSFCVYWKAVPCLPSLPSEWPTKHFWRFFGMPVIFTVADFKFWGICLVNISGKMPIHYVWALPSATNGYSPQVILGQIITVTIVSAPIINSCFSYSTRWESQRAQSSPWPISAPVLNSGSIKQGKKKQININKCAGLSRDWVGGKKLFMCFFRVIPFGGEENT